MNLLHKIWSNFKTQPDVWFFYGFLITFTLSIRKVLFFYPIRGEFNEYSGIYLYLSDIFLLLIIISWFISILCNKKSFLSILSSPSVPRGTFLLPSFLVFWSFLLVFWSNNPNIALFKSFKLLEFYFLFIFIITQIVPRGTFLKNTLKLIIGIAVIQSIIGIWQFIIQHSIGLFWLKESLISPEILGVAKVIFNDEKFVRAYGLFPHPNILGGFLLLSIILTITYSKMFHGEHFIPNNSQKCSTGNISTHSICASAKIVPRGTIIILSIQILVLILTFSKSAIIGLIIALTYIYWKQNVPRGTFLQTNLSKMFPVEHFVRKIILSFGILLALAIITKPNINALFIKSLDERLVYLNVSRGTILTNPLLGLGAGQFVLEMNKFVPRGTSLEIWQFQPVHNVFLLIWSELGLVGLGLFIWWLWKLFHGEQFYNSITAKNVPRGTIYETTTQLKEISNTNCSPWNKNTFKGILLGIIFIMFFDHYFWDIQQGQILLWIVLAFCRNTPRRVPTHSANFKR